jgi:Tfp pilus assembly protein PilV
MRGIRPGKGCRKDAARSQRGVTLIETLIAGIVLIIVVVGLLPVFVFGLQTTSTEGNVATRTTEYAQDKMEQLLALTFNDAGLGGGAMAASTSVGSIPPSAVVTNFVDYLDANGNVATSTGAYYTRQWMISIDATQNLKTITVVVSSVDTPGIIGLPPSATLVSVKANGL